MTTTNLPLMERELDGYNKRITLETVDGTMKLRVSVLDSAGNIEWNKEVETGFEAVDIFWHPFARGYREE